MAIFANSTPMPAPQQGLLRRAGTDAIPADDFSPAAIMARADEHAADQARRAAARPAIDDPRTSDDLLEEISREIGRQEGHLRTEDTPSDASVLRSEQTLLGGLVLFLKSQGKVARVALNSEAYDPSPRGVVPSEDTRFSRGAADVRDVIAKPAGLSSERSFASSAQAAALPPLPVPLPPLTSALSRRRAIFGAVVLAAAPVAALPAQAAPVLSANDRRLVALADAYEALDRRCNEHTAAHRHDHTPATDDEFDVLTSGFGPLEEECAATPADSLVGIIAKARLCRSPTARGCADFEHIASIADDLYRLHAAGRITHA